MRRFLIPALALTALGGLAVAPETLHSEGVSHPVSPGDVLQIVVYAGGEKAEDFTQAVRPEGAITGPLVRELRVAGMTVSEIASKLEEILARDYYVDPRVLVSVKEYGGRVYVLGEVKHAGVYSLQVAPTALSACVLAGGFTDFAAPRHGKVTRLQDGKPKVIEIDLIKVRQGRALDLTLLPGDRIEVPRRRF